MKKTFEKIIALDEELSRKIRVAEKPGPTRSIAMFFAHSGDSWFWGVGLLLIWIFAGQQWKEWAMTQLLLIVALAILVLLIKFSIRRKRPEGEWGAIYRNTDPHSFPSGHAARAFLVAMIAIMLGPTWIAIVLCIWAPLVTLSRVLMGVHYLSDVIAGAILGSIIALVGVPFIQSINLIPFIGGLL